MTMIEKTEENPLGLEPYEGEAVTEIGFELIGASGGLNEPLEADEALIDLMAPITKGDTVYLVMQLSKAEVKHVSAKSHDGWKRVDRYRVDGAAIVDADVATDAIEDQRERVRIAKERASGVSSMFMKDGQPSEDASLPEGLRVVQD